jgi:hypothetical protein
VGGIDESGQIRYSPFATFQGGDSFEYTATARGVTSAPARVTVTVTGPPALAPSPGAPAAPAPATPAFPGIATGLKQRWHATATSTTVRTLSVTNIPAGATITVTCTGNGCRFTSKKITYKKAMATEALARLFNTTKKSKGTKKTIKVVSRLRPPAKVEIRITQPGHVGKALVFTVRKSKSPSLVSSCLAPGSTKKTAC